MEESPRLNEQTSSPDLAELSLALRDLTDQRQREQEIRLIEAKLEEQRIANAHEYSLAHLKTSLQDRDNQRQLQKRNSIVGAIAAILLALLLLGFFSLAVWKGKDQIVLEVVKAVFAFLGGYGLGRRGKNKDDEDTAPKPKDEKP